MVLKTLLGADRPIKFNEQGFFLYILPPIIFAAGYTMNKKSFIRSIGVIFALGVVGTILAMTIISVILAWANDYFAIRDESGGIVARWVEPMECLLLAAVLCSTDTVAVLTLVTADKYRTLNSVLFGEGVVNDAVAILLFNAINNLIKSKSHMSAPDHAITEKAHDGGLKSDDLLWLTVDFFYLSITSLLLGIAVALMTALILKHIDMDSNAIS